MDRTLNHARAAEEKLQEAAQGGQPVAIPAAYEPQKAPAAQPSTPNASFERAVPEEEDDRRDYELEGGGKPRS